MTYPVKIEFAEYVQGQTPSYTDWSEYLVEAPTVNKRVESELEGEAGVIVFDSASVTFRYESGNPVYAKFSIDLSSKQRYLFKISAPKSNKTYVQLFEGMADFSTIEWAGDQPIISFEIMDKLSALGVLSASLARVENNLQARIDANTVNVPEIITYENLDTASDNTMSVYCQIHDDGGNPAVEPFTAVILNPGEIISVPDDTGTEFTDYVVVSSSLDVNGKNAITVAPSHNSPGTVVNQNIPAFVPRFYEKEIYNSSAINIISAGVLQGLDGIELIKLLYQKVWDGAGVTKIPSSLSFTLPPDYGIRLIDDSPFGQTPLEALTTLANSIKPSGSVLSGCYLYVDKSGGLVIHAINNLTGGTNRTIGSTFILSKNRKYFWDKLSDGASVTVKSFILDAATGDYLEGNGSKTLAKPLSTESIKPKNEVSKTILSDNSSLDTQDDLDSYALSEAGKLLDFYGKRHESMEYVFDLDDNTINWDLIDYLTDSSKNYFFTKLEIDLVERSVTLEAVDVTGHTFDFRSIITITSEDSGGTIRTSSSSSGGSGGGGIINVDFTLPLLDTAGVVSLEYEDNLILSVNNKLDTAQPLKITDTPQFAKLGIGQAADATYVLAATGDAKITGNILATTDINAQGNLKADKVGIISSAYNPLAIQKNTLFIGIDNDYNTFALTGYSWSNAYGMLWNSYLKSGATGGDLLQNNNTLNSVNGDTFGKRAGAFVYRAGAGEYVWYTSAPFGDGVGKDAATAWDLKLRLKYDGQLILSAQAAETGAAVRADRIINTTAPLAGGNNLVNDLTLSFAYNTTNLKLTSNELNTIQDIHTAADPTFAKLHISQTILKTGSTIGLLIQNESEDGTVVSGGLNLVGNSFDGSANRGGVWAGATSDLGTYTARATTGSGINLLDGDINFYTFSGATIGSTVSISQRMTIGNDGNVGINKINPVEKLHLAGHFKHEGNYSLYNNFTSGWTGSGWRLDLGITYPSESHLEIDNLTVRGTMRVYELIINQIRATNGTLYVSSSAKVDSIGDQGPPVELIIEDPSGTGVAPFLPNDIIITQSVNLDSTTVVKRIVAKVTSVTGLSVYVDTLTGAPGQLDDFASGDVIVRIGNTSNTARQDSIYLTSDDSNSPYLSVITDVASWADWRSPSKEKVRLGRLSGITDSTFGSFGSAEYGLYTRNVYLSSNSTTGIALKVSDASAVLTMKQSGNTIFDFNTSTSTAKIASWEINNNVLKNDSYQIFVGTNLSSEGGAFANAMSFGQYNTGLNSLLLRGNPSSNYIALAVNTTSGYAYQQVIGKTTGSNNIEVGIGDLRGISETGFGLILKEGSTEHFKFTETEKQIAGWEFTETKFFKNDVRIETSASFDGFAVDESGTDVLKVGDFTNSAESYFSQACTGVGSWAEHFEAGFGGSISNPSGNPMTIQLANGDSTHGSFLIAKKSLTLSQVKGRTVKANINIFEDKNLGDMKVGVSVGFMINGDRLYLVGLKEFASPGAASGVSVNVTDTVYANIPTDATSVDLIVAAYFNDYIIENPRSVVVDLNYLEFYNRSSVEINKNGFRAYASPIQKANLNLDGAMEMLGGKISADNSIKIGDWEFRVSNYLISNGVLKKQLSLYLGSTLIDQWQA